MALTQAIAVVRSYADEVVRVHGLNEAQARTGVDWLARLTARTDAQDLRDACHVIEAMGAGLTAAWVIDNQFTRYSPLDGTLITNTPEDRARRQQDYEDRVAKARDELRRRQPLHVTRHDLIEHARTLAGFAQLFGKIAAYWSIETTMDDRVRQVFPSNLSGDTSDYLHKIRAAIATGLIAYVDLESVDSQT